MRSLINFIFSFELSPPWFGLALFSNSRSMFRSFSCNGPNLCFSAPSNCFSKLVFETIGPSYGLSWGEKLIGFEERNKGTIWNQTVKTKDARNIVLIVSCDGPAIAFLVGDGGC